MLDEIKSYIMVNLVSPIEAIFTDDYAVLTMKLIFISGVIMYSIGYYFGQKRMAEKIQSRDANSIIIQIGQILRNLTS